MFPPPLATRDAHLVRAQSLYSDELFALRQVLGLHGGVGHEEEEEDAEQDCQGPAEDEDHLVPVDPFVHDVTQAVGDKAADDLRHTVHGVPVRRAQRLLGAAPPHLRYRDAARRDQGLEGPQEEP